MKIENCTISEELVEIFSRFSGKDVPQLDASFVGLFPLLLASASQARYHRLPEDQIALAKRLLIILNGNDEGKLSIAPSTTEKEKRDCVENANLCKLTLLAEGVDDAIVIRLTSFYGPIREMSWELAEKK